MSDEINVVSKTQVIVVEPASSSISIINAGPQGPSAAYGAWDAWTPVIKQGATLSKNVISSAYLEIGKLVVARMSVQFTSSGTAGQPIECDYPILPKGMSGEVAIGGFRFLDSGTRLYTGLASQYSQTSIRFFYDGYGSYLGTAETVANNDSLEFFITYEAA